MFKSFVKRGDIGIIIINQFVGGIGGSVICRLPI